MPLVGQLALVCCIVGALAATKTVSAQSPRCRAGETAWAIEGAFMGAADNGVAIVFSKTALLGVRMTDGATLWQLRSPPSIDRRVCILKDGGRVGVAGLIKQEGKVTVGVLDPGTGKYYWQRTFPLMKRDTVFIYCAEGAQSFDFMQVSFSDENLDMYLSIADGTVLWSTSPPRLSSQLVRNDVVVYSSNDGLIGHDPRNGTILWEFELTRQEFARRFQNTFWIGHSPNRFSLFNSSTGQIQWTKKGAELDNEDVKPGEPIEIRRRREEKYCVVEPLTGQDVLCLRTNFNRKYHIATAASGGDVVRVFRPPISELQRISSATGEVLYSFNLIEKEFRNSAPGFIDIPYRRGVDTYMIDEYRLIRISKNKKKIWTSRIPRASYKPRVPRLTGCEGPLLGGRLRFLARRRQQIVFLFDKCDGQGLVSFNRKTGRVAWVVHEQLTSVGGNLNSDFFKVFVGDNLAVFSTTTYDVLPGPGEPSLLGAGFVNVTVRGTRTRC